MNQFKHLGMRMSGIMIALIHFARSYDNGSARLHIS